MTIGELRNLNLPDNTKLMISDGFDSSSEVEQVVVSRDDDMVFFCSYTARAECAAGQMDPEIIAIQRMRGERYP